MILRDERHFYHVHRVKFAIFPMILRDEEHFYIVHREKFNLLLSVDSLGKGRRMNESAAETRLEIRLVLFILLRFG